LKTNDKSNVRKLYESRFKIGIIIIAIILMVSVARKMLDKIIS